MKIRLIEANSFRVFLFLSCVKTTGYGRKAHVLKELFTKYKLRYISLGDKPIN